MKINLGDIIRDKTDPGPTHAFMLCSTATEFLLALFIDSDGAVRATKVRGEAIRQDHGQRFEKIGHVPVKKIVQQYIEEADRPRRGGRKRGNN